MKRLRPDEDYLKDHFPRFPVMPGVLMLEAMYQASAWLVRQSEGFINSIVVLKEARNIKYTDFVTPGKELVVTAEILKQDDTTTTLKAQGTIDEQHGRQWAADLGAVQSRRPLSRCEPTPTPICADHFRGELAQPAISAVTLLTGNSPDKPWPG